MKIGDLIRDIRDGSMGVVIRIDHEHKDPDRYWVRWISGDPDYIKHHTSEYLGSDWIVHGFDRCPYRLVTSS